MNYFDIHVCLVSAQATPNLVPILSTEFRPKQVILLVTEKMQREAELLSAVAKKYSVKCTSVSIDAYDIEKMQDQLLQVVTDHASDSIALNVTGGTKLMAIMAQEVFRMASKSVFYFNIDSNVIQFIDNKPSSMVLPTRIRLEDYLGVHGYHVELPLERQLSVSEARKRLTETLIKEVKLFSSAIGKINAYASKAEKTDHRRGRDLIKPCLDVEVDDRALDDPNWSKVVDLFSDAKILSLSGKTLKFSDLDARFYANGGWLEDHVFGIVQGLQLQDMALNMRVENTSGAGHSKNELDVAFLKKNRLHIVECKSRNFENNEHGTEALYKLDSLSSLGGLNTKCMLVSYRELRDADRQRAKDLRIRVVDATQLQGLKNQIETWISQ